MTGVIKVRTETVQPGLWRVRLCAPKANILDSAMVSELTEVFREAGQQRELKAVCLCAEGGHFSFGASVQEHLPEAVGDMLRTFHGLFGAIAETDVVTLAAVRGQCLGGGLELVSFCNRVFAAPDANLGQPEIQLGVFAPIASLLLPERIGRGSAEHLCLSGQPLTVERALQVGLVDEVAEDPEVRAIEYASEFLLPRSASSLRQAVRAVRRPFYQRLFPALAEIERQYLDELMATADAEEGIRAFLDKRPAKWSNA